MGQVSPAKGGVKAHVLLDHDDYLPSYVPITEAKRSYVKMAEAFTLNPGSIVAMDRGYNDYGLFGKWTAEEIYFVPPEGKCGVRSGEGVCGSEGPQHSVGPTDPVSLVSRLKRIAPACCGGWWSGMR